MVGFKFSLFDDDDLKRIEDTIARAVMRGLISAAKVIDRDGLFRMGVETGRDVAHKVADQFIDSLKDAASVPEETPQTSISEDDARPSGSEVVRPLPVFLKPQPENAMPNGRAVEPPVVKGHAKTQALFTKLYKTVATKPNGTFMTQSEAARFLGDAAKYSGPVSTWLQNGQLDAIIVADMKPPTKGLPGKLLIRKESLIARNAQRASTKSGKSERSGINRKSSGSKAA